MKGLSILQVGALREGRVEGKMEEKKKTKYD